MAHAHLPEPPRSPRSRRPGVIDRAPQPLARSVPEELLGSGAIAAKIAAGGKRQLLSTIAEMAARVYGLRASAVFDALREREAKGSTGVGFGVALPHARVPGLGRPRGVFVRLASPIEFDAVDDQPVDLAFALLTPHASSTEHLRLLARLARTLRSPEMRRQLRVAPGAGAIRALLVSGMG